MSNYMKTCSFYMFISLKHIISRGVSENIFWWKLSFIKKTCCRCTLELPQWRNSNVYQQHMLLKIKKTIWNLHLSRIISIVFAPFEHVKLPISIKISATVLQFVNIYMTAISLNLISLTTSLLTRYLHSCNIEMNAWRFHPASYVFESRHSNDF